MNRILFSIFVMICLASPIGAVAVSIARVEVGSSGLQQEQVMAHFQTEIQDGSAYAVRDYNAVKDTMKLLEECQLGLRKDCTDVALKGVDIVVFGEFAKIGDRFTFSARAVNVRSYQILVSVNESGSNPDRLMSKTAEKIKDKFAQLQTQNWNPAADDADKYKYRIAVREIRYANVEAQKIKTGGILNSVLISAFGQQRQFQVVEQTRIADLIHEKELAMDGIVSSDNAAFEARGITHYVVGSLKAFDGTNVLSYQIINVKTGMPIVQNIIEWTEDTDLQPAMQEVAVQSAETIFERNGKLNVKLCVAKDTQQPVQNVKIAIEKKTEGAFPQEFGFCPLLVEDMPKGSYTVILSHEDYDSTILNIEVTPQQAVIVDKVEMPTVDLGAFNKASDLEAMGNYGEAVAKYREFYQAYPRYRMSAYAMYREGFVTQVYLRRFDAGRKILEEVIKRKPDAEIRSETYYGISLGYREAGQTEKAKEVMKMLVTEYAGSTAAESAKNCLDLEQCGL